LNPKVMNYNKHADIDKIASQIVHKFKYRREYEGLHHDGSSISCAIFKQFFSWRECARVRREYQQKRNISYDWVICTSPQLEPQIELMDISKLDNNFLYCPKDPCPHKRRNCHFGGYYDGFVFGSPEATDYVCDIYDWIIANKEGKLVHPERNLKEYIDLKYQMKFVDMWFNRVRYNGDREDH